MYAGNDENFKFILKIYLNKSKFSLNLSAHYESFKSNLLNNDFSIGVIEEDIIKGKLRLFHNDLKSLKKKITPFDNIWR